MYKWITSTTTFQGFKGVAGVVLKGNAKKMDPDYKNNGNIKWNFTKILIDRNGEIVARIEPSLGLKDIEAKIKEIL